MAKSKRKHRKQSSAFYEALPTTAIPPLGLPLDALQTQLTREALTDVWLELLANIKPIAIKAWSAVLQAGLSTSELIIEGTKHGLLAARLTTEATITYAPSIAIDAFDQVVRTRRRLASRQAKYFYLSLFVLGAVAATAAGVITAENTIRAYSSDISSPAALLAKKKTGITILDRNGQVLFDGYGANSNGLVDLNNIPNSLKEATLAAEDPSFYDHTGFSWRSTTRAAIADFTHQNKAEGGSTLTQQLVKNALLTSNKNFERKYQEILLSMELENHYSKDEILDMYLSETYYGQGSSGVEDASLTYFHKQVKDLTLSESALLAGLPLGPSRLDPNVDLAAATGRRDYVINRMLELGKITKSAAEEAKSEPLVLASSPAVADDIPVYSKMITIKAPHFVFYVLDQLRSKYGESMIENGGMTVKTTLDLSKQAIAEQAVSVHIGDLASHHVTNGGLVSLDPGTGDIMAMVGSVDYNAPGFGNVNVTLSQLQPGSSFKPIAYATAFKKGWTGANHVDDAPLSVPNGDGTMYTPQNYDGKFRGSVSLRQALSNSLNIPAIKVLQFAGIPDTLQTAHDLGITSLNDPSRYGLSLVLGGGEVSPLDMATAYAAFDHAGVKVTPRAILSVTDKYGKVLSIAKPPAVTPPVLDPRIAYMITNILSDNTARTPEFGANSPLLLDRPAAAKTGTTNDFRDNWTVGYTPQLVTAVWVGNNDHTPMNNVDGITGAAPIWHDYMEGSLAKVPPIDFTVPTGVTSAKVCASDGGLANPWDTGYNEVFMSSNMPTKTCGTQAPQPTSPFIIPTPMPVIIDPNQINQDVPLPQKFKKFGFPGN